MICVEHLSLVLGVIIFPDRDRLHVHKHCHRYSPNALEDNPTLRSNEDPFLSREFCGPGHCPEFEAFRIKDAGLHTVMVLREEHGVEVGRSWLCLPRLEVSQAVKEKPADDNGRDNGHFSCFTHIFFGGVVMRPRCCVLVRTESGITIQ